MTLVRAALCREDEHVGLSICVAVATPMYMSRVRRLTAGRDGSI